MQTALTSPLQRYSHHLSRSIYSSMQLFPPPIPGIIVVCLFIYLCMRWFRTGGSHSLMGEGGKRKNDFITDENRKKITFSSKK